MQATQNKVDQLKIYYSNNVKPTRRTVVDQSSLNIVTGGVNYFPFDPINPNISYLDKTLMDFANENYYEANLNFIAELLDNIQNANPAEWTNTVFIVCIQAFAAYG
jgi:hypothetical protein